MMMTRAAAAGSSCCKQHASSSLLFDVLPVFHYELQQLANRTLSITPVYVSQLQLPRD